MAPCCWALELYFVSLLWTGVVQKKDGHVNGSEVSISGGGDPVPCQTLTPRRSPGGAAPAPAAGSGSEAKEEGSYSVSNAAVNYTAAAYSRTASPPRRLQFNHFQLPG